MFISESNLAALTGTSLATTQSWANKKIYPSCMNAQGIRGFEMTDMINIPEVNSMVNNHWDEEFDVIPARDFTSVELFAGAGGLALGMAKAGFHHVLLNEFDRAACKTLKSNQPDWNIIEGDVRHIDFTPLRGKVDFLSGGFPCQAFSYAGKQGGFSDTRGTLFFELARAVTEIQPKVFMCENVKGLKSHDEGRTFATICNAIRELGYTLVEPRVLKAIMYQVPQKRERLILIAIRNDLAPLVEFHWPSPYERVLTLRDALFRSVIFDTDVPKSEGIFYPEKKRRVLAMVPEGGDWRNLPEDVAKEYMGGSWLLGGGKTGMARRLSLDEPSLTLTCSPCQKQTERCHPLETRPLSVREYARIQTFPDEWEFSGTISDKYKQIGNAVPVNLAWAVGRSLIRLFNDIQQVSPSQTEDCDEAVKKIMKEQSQLVVVKNNETQTSEIKGVAMQLNFLDMLDFYPDLTGTGAPMVKEDISINYGRSCRLHDFESENRSVASALVKLANRKLYIANGNIFEYKKFEADGIAAFIKGGENFISSTYDAFLEVPHSDVIIHEFKYDEQLLVSEMQKELFVALDNLAKHGCTKILVPPINVKGKKGAEKDISLIKAINKWLKTESGQNVERVTLVDIDLSSVTRIHFPKT